MSITNHTNILDGLTESQLEAVTHFTGPMLVVAGAGSGKTRVVTRRVAWLVGEKNVKPWRIMALTFTNKAAGEMRQRVAELTGQAPQFMGTFHSICARFLRQYLDTMQGERDGKFTIYDSDDQQALLRQIIKEQSIDDKKFKPRSLSAAISKAKCDMVAPEDYGDGSWYDDIIAKAYREYERLLRKTNALDFDDLLLQFTQLLKKVDPVREKLQEQFRFLLVDEYQDTNKAQYQLLRLLCGEENNIHATGDPDQSIYSWRGADYSNIMDFQKDFPGAKIVRLERNYRSTKNILNAANHVIKFNSDRIEKNLFTKLDEGEPVHVVALERDRGEAEWITSQISRLQRDGEKRSNMAIFYRTNAQSRALEEALMGSAIPYQIVGGIRFYERKEIKDLLAHIKLLVNPRDEISLRRVVSCRPTGVGDKTLENIQIQSDQLGLSSFEFLSREDFLQSYTGRATAKLRDFVYWCQKIRRLPSKPVGEAVREIINASGLVEHISTSHKDPSWEDRLENIDAFSGRALEFEREHPDADLAEFLEDVALVADVDTYDPNADNVVLMTLHSAKGLEFPVVFLSGLENGLLPHANSKGELAKEEEERRLFYVGITRAQEKLYITRSGMRMQFGKIDYAMPSPFLRELPLDELDCADMTDMGSYISSGLDAIDDDFDIGMDGSSGSDPFIDEFAPNPLLLGKTTAPKKPDPFLDEISTAPTSLPPKKAKPATPFKVGDHVEHPKFGKGKVLSCSRTQAVVQFFGGRSRLLSLSGAGLSKC